MNERTENACACNVPAVGKDLLQVQSGVPVFHAISTADCLDDAVLKLLDKAVCNGEGMDTQTAFLCWFALDVSGALRSAAGTTA